MNLTVLLSSSVLLLHRAKLDLSISSTVGSLMVWSASWHTHLAYSSISPYSKATLFIYLRPSLLPHALPIAWSQLAFVTCIPTVPTHHHFRIRLPHASGLPPMRQNVCSCFGITYDFLRTEIS
jgi:hypothetical protein